MPVPKKKRTRKPKSSSKSSPASSLLAAGKSRRSMSSEAAVVRHTHESSQPFFLLHHPRNWRIVAEGLDAPAIVPDLQKLPLQPGVNGVRTRQPHEPESATYQRAVEELSRDGFSVLMPDEVIPADCLPDGLEGEGYLREYLCRGPISQRNGSHYVEVWSVPQPVYPGEVQRYKFDRSAYHRWLCRSRPTFAASGSPNSRRGSPRPRPRRCPKRSQHERRRPRDRHVDPRPYRRDRSTLATS